MKSPPSSVKCEFFRTFSSKDKPAVWELAQWLEGMLKQFATMVR